MRARSATRRGSSPSLVEQGQRTLCFAKSRKAAELIHRFTLDRLGREYADRLSPYRAGYTPAQRRDIEQRLAAGELLGRLRDGRARARDRHRAARLRRLGRLPRHGREPAPAVGPSRADRVTASQCSSRPRTRSTSTSCASRRRCSAAASRRRSRPHEPRASSTATCSPPRSRRRSTTRTGRRSETRRSIARPSCPSFAGRALASSGPAATTRPRACRSVRRASTRCSSSSADDGAVLGVVERERAYSTVHDGAVYLHLGQSYLVERARSRRRRSRSSSRSRATGTRRRRRTRRRRSRRACASRAGAASSSRSGASPSPSTSSRTRSGRRATEPMLETVPLDLPPSTYETEAVWFVPPESKLEGIDRMPQLVSALHAAEHALIALLPLWAMCDRWDIGGLSTNVHFQTGAPTVFVYDGHPGGVGITERGFAASRTGWRTRHGCSTGCPCETGCPSCVQSPKCGNLNELLDKAAALLPPPPDGQRPYVGSRARRSRRRPARRRGRRARRRPRARRAAARRRAPPDVRARARCSRRPRRTSARGRRRSRPSARDSARRAR